MSETTATVLVAAIAALGSVITALIGWLVRKGVNFMDQKTKVLDEASELQRKEAIKNKIVDTVTLVARATMQTYHFDEVKKFKEEMVARTMAAIKDRLTKEINYWDRRAEELKEQELAGKPNARINSAKARERANDLEAVLHAACTRFDASDFLVSWRVNFPYASPASQPPSKPPEKFANGGQSVVSGSTWKEESRWGFACPTGF